MGISSNSESSTERSAFESKTFEKDASVQLDEAIGAASVSPSGRDAVLASRNGLYIIDLDSLWSPPRYIPHHSPWEVADIQWSPFASRDYWIVSTSNQKALVFNLEMSPRSGQSLIEHVLHAHSRAITDINFSAYHPDLLATCAVDSFVHCWDLRQPQSPALSFNQTPTVKFTRPVAKFADWDAGATQVKWNRQDEHIIASSHDRYLRIWDRRKGAIPLRTIDAHSTKIYGIDWNRTKTTGILTCSLDHTIKIWDYSVADDNNNIVEPERVFRTPFPVWRARHTPFGWGVLAMPQRGNHDLHLYDRRLSKGLNRDDAVPAVHTFSGHHDNVKEFLWRSRGGVDDGVDNREFQLVSWGSDRYLHLHRIEPDILKSVGFEKGKEVHKKMYLPRQGAVYKSFRDEPLRKDRAIRAPVHPPLHHGNLTTLFQTAGMNKAPIPTTYGFRDGGSMTRPTGMQLRSSVRKAVNPITWMEGVKIGKREPGLFAKWGAKPTILSPGTHFGWDTPESLGDEITHVGAKFKRVTFEKVDVSGRTATVALYGPWGIDNKQAFVRISFEFPADYPRSAAPTYHIEKTTASIGDPTIAKLESEIQTIANIYLKKQRGCLEAIISYAVGERGLEESMNLLANGNDLDGDVVADSSSDDEDGIGVDYTGQSQDMEMSGADMIGTLNSPANVPLHKTCGAVWSRDGRLVCFFPPKEERKPLFSLTDLRNSDRYSKRSIFDTFGRLHNDSPEPPHRSSLAADDDLDSMHESWASSSTTSSSSSSDEIPGLPGAFQPPAAWRGAILRFQKSSQPSSIDHAAKPPVTKPKSVIAMHGLEDMLPSKRVLAEEYEIYGDGPTICSHNAEVARSHGLHDLADIWSLCKLVLANEVPLEVMPLHNRKDQVLVLARRALVRIKRKDSGMDLAFDEADAVANPKLKSRVKWGHHPLGGAWLIPTLFEYFEKLADVQMLAMLSCIFSEPVSSEGLVNAMTRVKRADLPMAMQAPAFALDYYPTKDIALSLYTPSSSVSTPVPSHGRQTPNPAHWDRFTKGLDGYGSAGSSNGQWSSEATISDPVTPYSTGTTPPLMGRANTLRTSAVASFSSSPEQHGHSRRSNSNLANAFASLSRPFSITASSSPPTQPKRRTSEADLSTSAPNSSITWGANTFYSSTGAVGIAARLKHVKRRSISQYERVEEEDLADGGQDSDDSDEDEDLPIVVTKTGTEAESAITMKFKNQDQFDDESCVSTPLLEGPNDAKYQIYRQQYAEQLVIWGLSIPRGEILKFNGLLSYWPDGEGLTGINIELVSKHLKPPQGQQGSRPLSPQPSRMLTPTSATREFKFNPNADEFVPSWAAMPTLHEGVLTQMAQAVSLEKPVFDSLGEVFLEILPWRSIDVNSRPSTPGQTTTTAARRATPMSEKFRPNRWHMYSAQLEQNHNIIPESSSKQNQTPRNDEAQRWKTKEEGQRFGNANKTAQEPGSPSGPKFCAVCWRRIDGFYRMDCETQSVSHMSCLEPGRGGLGTIGGLQGTGLLELTGDEWW